MAELKRINKGMAAYIKGRNRSFVYHTYNSCKRYEEIARISEGEIRTHALRFAEAGSRRECETCQKKLGARINRETLLGIRFEQIRTKTVSSRSLLRCYTGLDGIFVTTTEGDELFLPSDSIITFRIEDAAKGIYRYVAHTDRKKK